MFIAIYNEWKGIEVNWSNRDEGWWTLPHGIEELHFLDMTDVFFVMRALQATADNMGDSLRNERFQSS